MNLFPKHAQAEDAQSILSDVLQRSAPLEDEAVLMLLLLYIETRGNNQEFRDWLETVTGLRAIPGEG